jgi:hypothetical protein
MELTALCPRNDVGNVLWNLFLFTSITARLGPEFDSPFGCAAAHYVFFPALQIPINNGSVLIMGRSRSPDCGDPPSEVYWIAPSPATFCYQIWDSSILYKMRPAPSQLVLQNRPQVLPLH